MPRKVCPIPFVIFPPEIITNDHDLRRMSRELASKYAEGHAVTDADLKNIGRQLWNSLRVQDNFDAAVKNADGAILPVIIESDKADVQALPWETLYHPTYGFIGGNPDFTLTRRIAGGKSVRENLDKGPLRVLLFTSLPDDVHPEYGRLNVEVEQEQVQEALLEWIRAGVVQLEMPDDGRFSTLQELLKSFDPHVLFLSGHGKFHHEPHADEAYGEFLFESETGDGEAIRDEEIARVLAETRVQAVILSACESGKSASDSLSNGLMQRISAEGISHVVGMRESIYDIAGIQFARALCDALAGQEHMDVALQSARVAIQTAMDDRGQWCLPMALSPNPQARIIDWDFQPQAAETQRLNQRVNTISLPARFVGRRAEMRRYKIKLTQGALRSLLITGAGGMGKTSLVGKLALDVQKARGDQLFAWSANSEKSWRDFELEMGQTLDKPRVERYDKFLPKAENEVARAKFMLDLLVEQFNGRVILFFDNLEILQDADSLAVKDATVAAWMQAAHGTDGVTVFATSRWQIPDWDGEYLMLARANYGDFLQIAAMKNLPIRREHMRRVYDALGGNIRGLEFFAVATQVMDDENAEETFLQTLEQSKNDLQANMAIAEIFKHLPDDAKKILARLPAYHEAVPIEGLLKLGEDFPDTETLLERLMAVSLLEASYEPHWNVTEYQCAPMVTDWMNENGLVDNSRGWLSIAANYHAYLHFNKRNTLSQAIVTHHALRRAGYHLQADSLTLDYIVKPMSLAGFYTTLINDWLLRICNSEDLAIKGRALNEIGKLYKDISDYDAAILYLKQSFEITRQTNNKQGEGAALNNIAQIYDALGNYEVALTYYRQALALMQQIGDKANEGMTLMNIGQIFYMQGDYATALTTMKQSLTIRQQIGDIVGESMTINNISNIFYQQGDYETALAYYKQALAIQQQIGDIAGEGATLNNIAQIYEVQGDYETPLTYLKQSLVISQKVGNKADEGVTLNNISQIYHTQGDYETALAYLKQALAIQQQIGDKAGEGTTLNNISALYNVQGDYKTAITYYKQALVIKQQIGDKDGEGTILNNISVLCHSVGDYEAALTYLKQSLTIRQQMGDKAGESVTLNNISQIYDVQGDYETALAYLKQSLAIIQQIGDKAGESTMLNNISHIYATQNDYETALTFLKQSLSISQQISDKASEGTALNNISGIYYDQGDYATALIYLKQSLAIRQQIGDKVGEAATLNNISQIYHSERDYKTALTYLQQALVIQQQLDDKVGLCATLYNIGRIHAQNNQIQEAVSAWVTVYLFARQINYFQALQSLSKLAPQLGMPEGLDGWEQLAQRMNK